MTKHLLAGVAGVVLMSGVGFADTYPPTPPPSMPLAPPPAVSSPGDKNPPAAAPGSSGTTTAPNSGIERDTHREGIAGSTKQETGRDGGTTTRSNTTTKQE